MLGGIVEAGDHTVRVRFARIRAQRTKLRDFDDKNTNHWEKEKSDKSMPPPSLRNLYSDRPEKLSLGKEKKKRERIVD